MKDNTLNILFVGTEQTIVDSIKSDGRFNISQHTTPLSAWNELSSNDKGDFDAIVSQVNTPGLNGIDFYKYIKEQRSNIKISFILVSFQNDNLIKSKALNLGIDDYFEAPINIDQLYTRACFLKKVKARKGNLKSSIKKDEFKLPFLKRSFDIVVSLISIILLSPIFITTAIAIRFESKGKVIYKSKRVGNGYKIFNFYKFRSMRVGADSMLKSMSSKNQYSSQQSDQLNEKCEKCTKLGKPCSPILYVDGKQICEHHYLEIQKQKKEAAFFKFEDDPRITKVGHFIRRTSIDELPQLFNVLIGDMSLVGNRPLPLYEAELITSDSWSMRFNAPAGITGLWQVRERGKGGEMSAEERKSLDNEYAMHNNFWYDIKILFLTVFSFLQKDNV